MFGGGVEVEDGDPGRGEKRMGSIVSVTCLLGCDSCESLKVSQPFFRTAQHYIFRYSCVRLCFKKRGEMQNLGGGTVASPCVVTLIRTDVVVSNLSEMA